MIAEGEFMRDLDSQIERIEKLDALRRRAQTLRATALRVLSEVVYGEERRGWRAPGDYVEQATILRALQERNLQEKSLQRESLLGKTFQQNAVETKGNLETTLKLLTPELLGGVAEATRGPQDHVPVFRAAVVMQALVEIPSLALSGTTLRCFYQIVEELYDVVPPASAAGAAKAGDTALASAFITGECARALLALRKALLDTAKAVELLWSAGMRDSSRPKNNIALWLEQDRVFREESLRVSLDSLRPHLVVDVSSGKENDPRALLKDLLGKFSTLPELNELSLARLVVKEAEAPKAAAKEGELPQAGERMENLDLDVTTRDLAEASRNIASKAVEKLLEILTGVADFANRVDDPPDKLAENIAIQLKSAAQMVRNLLDPVERYASSVIDREMAAVAHPGRTVDAAELVFSAALLGLLTSWENPEVKSALDLLLTLLSPGGRLLSIRPFDVLSRGYRLHVTTLEVTRRLAELLANLDVEPEPQLIERLMRPFEDTRALSQSSSEPGWAADPPGPKRESEWWVTALAVDALDCVIRMLDETINRSVLRHFSVRKPADLNLLLDQLFYPDFGLSAKREHDKKSVASELQQLRAHASGVKSPLFSLVLYGPPGTGKTTLVEALAKSADVPLVEITPSDILVGGQEAVERRTRLVFIALSMLTSAVILFDEFDPILQDRRRKKGSDTPTTVFEFLTPGLLPKLKKLHDAAKEHRVSYVLATNFVNRLDPAAVRQGRFDRKRGIYPPDVVSRVGRLMDEFQRWKKKPLTDKESQLVLSVLKATSGAPMDQLGRLGWYTAPPGKETPAPASPFSYIEKGNFKFDQVAREAEFDAEKKKRIAELAGELGLAVRDADKNEDVKAEFGLDYWENWRTVVAWDKMLSDYMLEGAGAPDWRALVDDWTKESK
jgi:hypothetical protein